MSGNPPNKKGTSNKKKKFTKAPPDESILPKPTPRPITRSWQPAPAPTPKDAPSTVSKKTHVSGSKQSSKKKTPKSSPRESPAQQTTKAPSSKFPPSSEFSKHLESIAKSAFVPPEEKSTVVQPPKPQTPDSKHATATLPQSYIPYLGSVSSKENTPPHVNVSSLTESPPEDQIMEEN